MIQTSSLLNLQTQITTTKQLTSLHLYLPSPKSTVSITITASINQPPPLPISSPPHHSQLNSIHSQLPTVQNLQIQFHQSAAHHRESWPCLFIISINPKSPNFTSINHRTNTINTHSHPFIHKTIDPCTQSPHTQIKIKIHHPHIITTSHHHLCRTLELTAAAAKYSFLP
jgi:hypothetical protein